MGPSDRASVSQKWSTAEIIGLSFTAFWLAAWLWLLPDVLALLEWAFRYDKGDTGYHVMFVVSIAGGAGLVGLMAAIPLAIYAKRLPRWLRIVMVSLPAGSIVFAATQIVGLFYGK